MLWSGIPALQWSAVALLALLFMLAAILQPANLRAVLHRLRWLRIIHYLGLTLAGLLLALVLRPGRDAPIAELVLLAAALAVFAFTVFESSVFLNDYFDQAIDRRAGKRTPVADGALGSRSSFILVCILGLVALVAAAGVGGIAFLLALACLAVSVIYSAPPLRLKRFWPLTTLLLAGSALLVILVGYSAAAGADTFRLFPARLAVLVLVTLTLAFGTKDIRDTEGDRAAGVVSLFTLLGARRGQRVNAALVLAAYVSAPLILAFPPLFWAAVPAGLASSALVLRRRFREMPIFLVYYAFVLVVAILIVTGRIRFA